LYSAIEFKQGVLLVGPSGSGKSTIYRILAKVLNLMHNKKYEIVVDTDLLPERQPGQRSLKVRIFITFSSLLAHIFYFSSFSSPFLFFLFSCTNSLLQTHSSPRCFFPFHSLFSSVNSAQFDATAFRRLLR
jgi:energy-coupling factor transporter ATP-binding protein EcfA2